MGRYVSYREKLRDPRWQRRRLECLQSADWKCQSCFGADHNLQVHHKAYRRGAEPWEYGDDELVVLCEDCHESRHLIEAELRAVLQELKPHEAQRVLAYAQSLLVISGAGHLKATLMLEDGKAVGVLDAIAGNIGGWDELEREVMKGGSFAELLNRAARFEIVRVSEA